jgi:hypothetical protein
MHQKNRFDQLDLLAVERLIMNRFIYTDLSQKQSRIVKISSKVATGLRAGG